VSIATLSIIGQTIFFKNFTKITEKMTEKMWKKYGNMLNEKKIGFNYKSFFSLILRTILNVFLDSVIDYVFYAAIVALENESWFSKKYEKFESFLEGLNPF
jgi:hypothetical protein